MLSVVIIGFIWQLILSPLWGIRRDAPRTRSASGSLFAPWLGQESTALLTVSLISVWQFVGIPMMLIYAALLAIPDELIDAATVDGADPFSVFWFVQLPLILPTLGVVSVLTFVANFNAFDLIYADQGRAGRAEFLDRHPRHLLLPHLLRLPAPARQLTMGATVATAMLLIILIGVLIYLFVVQRRLQRHTF